MNLFDAIRKNLNTQLNVDPEMFDDPFATTIDWTPLDNRNGASFQTHEAKKVSSERIEFHRTLFMKIFPFIFLLFPLVFLRLLTTTSGFPGIIGQISVAVFIIVFGVFVFVGVYLWRLSKKAIVFDKFQGYFWKGNIDPRGMNSQNENDFVRLTDIYALQIIAKRVRSARASVYCSYELNLVLKSGQRVGVVDHGNINALRADANKIADFMSVPLWDASIRQ